MKTTILTAIMALITLFSYGQNNIVTHYDAIPSYNAVIHNSNVFIPVGKERYNIEEYQAFNIGESYAKGKYKFPFLEKGKPLFDGKEFAYIHSSGKLSKYNLKTGEYVWESAYENSKWAAQTPPKDLSEKYIGVGVSDRVAVFNKETGELLIQVSGKGISEGFSLSGDEILIVSNDNGKNIAYDIKTGKELWSKKVGYTGGFGSTTEGDKIYLPSFEPYLYCLNKKTGKEIWKIDMKALSNGCGSGFSTPPYIVGDYLYTIHRDKGIFKFDKNTGKEILNMNEFGEVVGDLVPYKNYFLFIDVSTLYVFSPEKDEIIQSVELPINVRSSLEIVGDFGIITNYNFDEEPYQKGVMTINLTSLIK